MAKLSLFDRRRRRVRTALKARASGKPRLVGSSFGQAHLRPGHRRRSRQDAGRGLDPGQGSAQPTGSATSTAAAEVGKTLAERAKQAGVSRVVFDRGGFLFHGRVKALADAAREGGLEF